MHLDNFNLKNSEKKPRRAKTLGQTSGYQYYIVLIIHRCQIHLYYTGIFWYVELSKAQTVTTTTAYNLLKL